MDPSRTYKIKMRFHSTSRQDCSGAYKIIHYVDADRTNYKDFQEEICNGGQPWGHNQKIIMSYFDIAKKSYVLVETDQDMMTMFDVFSKYVELNVSFVPKTCTESIPLPKEMMLHTEIQSSSVSFPCTPAIDTPSQAGPNETTEPSSSSQPSQTTSHVETNYLANPFPMFEYVGVNEEGFYGEDVSDEEDEDSDDTEDIEESGGSEEESSDDSEEEVLPEKDVEEDIVVRDFIPTDLPQVHYDKDDPPMGVGSTYPSMFDFKIALATHALKNEFEYNTEKADSERVRAYCVAKHRGCKWRIHASALADRVTIQVKVNPARHTCGSRQRSKKMKHASKYWICEKVIDWVRGDSSVAATELQRRLKEKYHIDINYKRVHAGCNQVEGQDYQQEGEGYYKEDYHHYTNQESTSCSPPR